MPEKGEYPYPILQTLWLLIGHIVAGKRTSSCWVAFASVHQLRPRMPTHQMARPSSRDPIDPMDLANMRQNGVQSLHASCWLFP
jgi:hypothetical protein